MNKPRTRALPVDNNWIENQICPGPRASNWLFTGSLHSGKRAAAIMSLIQSARLNGHDPYAYLKDALTQLPTAYCLHSGRVITTNCCRINGRLRERVCSTRSSTTASPLASTSQGSSCRVPSARTPMEWWFRPYRLLRRAPQRPDRRSRPAGPSQAARLQPGPACYGLPGSAARE